mgnify:CR=1 FL=1|jgi:hypothetical protein
MDILNQITAVFSAMADWISDAVTSFVPMFYVAGESGGTGSLTLLGTLSVISLSMGVAFLLLRVITNFFQFRA